MSIQRPDSVTSAEAKGHSATAVIEADPNESPLDGSVSPLKGDQKGRLGGLDRATLVDLYHQMLLIRRFEEKSAEAYSMGKIGGFCHLYIGQEAVAVGAISAIRRDDYVLTSYREHAHARELLPAADVADADSGALRGDRDHRAIRRAGERRGRRTFRAGRRGAARNFARADHGDRDVASGAAQGRDADPRSARGRAQEIRASQGAQTAAILQTLGFDRRIGKFQIGSERA